ncbi:nucleotidyltransferase domain-containing protein [Candidatus Woesearchaeota archaeon]|nr:nucleotidyltransferase domain-containing protein [Candidatus Woesearchaeota archaeon]
MEQQLKKREILKLEKGYLRELDDAYAQVLHWFFSFPTREIGLNDLAAETKLAKVTVSGIIDDLEKEGFVKKRVYGKAWSLRCDVTHPYNFTYKVSFNLLMIYTAYLKGLAKLIFKEVGNAKAIILFGSYRKGDDTEESDIDLAVEVDDHKDMRIIELGVIPEFGFRENVKVNLHIFSRNKIDLNVFANIANGIVLEGFLEVHP